MGILYVVVRTSLFVCFSTDMALFGNWYTAAKDSLRVRGKCRALGERTNIFDGVKYTFTVDPLVYHLR